MVAYQTVDRNDVNSFIDSDGGSGSGCGYDYDDYEEVERLSFCDLPIDSSGGGGASFESKEGMHSSSEDQEDDFFEFFSGDLDSTTWDIDNVIFCGKLIPYRTPPPAHQTIKKNNEHQLPIKKQRQRFLEWKSGKNTTESRILSDGSDKKRKCGVASANNKKLAAAGELILASPTKAKWHLFLFGFTKNPTVVELSDMKNRQYRRTASSPVKYQSSDEATKVNEDTRNTSKKKTNSTTSGKGLWKLLKVLCCKNKVSIDGI